ncbi:MAG: ATP-binding protein [Propionibacteriaceae bacterium]|jgi:AAA+ ATPase superfamily predicted ATPase|nr:ATP-binding protein [Propionibacteriaceae bacterium]
MKIVGRKSEQEELRRHFDSGRPEFLAVTGRRRVGKTFLVKEMFKDDLTFYFSGAIGKGVTNAYQLRQFDKAIESCGGVPGLPSKDWADAFRKLKELLKKPKGQRQVLFIDELPWLDLPKSDFLSAVDNFWNTFASSRPDLMLVVCGSAASWIAKNIFHSKGGLHNRITGRVFLAPFSLGECEALFEEHGVVMNRYQIAESYMVFGGIPYYLGMFDKKFGPTQNVDRLLFAAHAPLKDEFYEVFRSLFATPDRHIRIVEALAKNQKGLTREEIIETTGIPGGGNLTTSLDELVQCDFIEKFSDFTKPKNDAQYRLVDPFILFWLRYVRNNETKDDYYWTNLIDDGRRRAWSGHAFELLCLRHVAQIKQTLGIWGVSTQVYAWRSRQSHPAAQIDLLINRKDGVTNLCEMKFSLHPYEISKTEAQKLEQRKMAFIVESKTTNAVHITMVTTYGLAEKGYRSLAQSEVTLDDLFR